MSFVVMGMEAPENCLKCLMNCRTPDGKIMCRRDFRERNPLVRDRCSIFPLPKEHGRLADSEEIMAEIKRSGIFRGDYLIALMDIVEGAKTIVESEE